MLQSVSTFSAVKQIGITSECGQTMNDAGCMIGVALPSGRARDFSVLVINHEIETCLKSLKAVFLLA